MALCLPSPCRSRETAGFTGGGIPAVGRENSSRLLRSPGLVPPGATSRGSITDQDPSVARSAYSRMSDFIDFLLVRQD